MLKSSLVLFVFLLHVGSDPIVRRHDVDDLKYVELGLKYGATVSSFSGGCGTLIRPTWVVTAAHVASASYFRNYMDIGGRRYEIKRKIIHPDFTMSQGVLNDIALIELVEPVPDIVPARLYKDSSEVGKEVVFAGTGWAGTGDRGLVEGHIEKDSQLRAAQNRVDGILGHYLQFTFDEPGSENALPLEGISGAGDSGGPALWFSDNQPYLIGVSSHQGGIGPNGVQGVYGVFEYYTRVSDYYDWIKDSLGETK